MKKYDYIIAIDPDREKSGVALLKPATRAIDANAMAFPALIDYLVAVMQRCSVNGESLVVVVEAGWIKHKSNFHGYCGGRAEKIAHDVGANHETGKKIIEMCKYYGINVIEHCPLVKTWNGRDGKITHSEIQKLTGYSKRTNQDVRDALLLAWVVSGLPMFIKV